MQIADKKGQKNFKFFVDKKNLDLNSFLLSINREEKTSLSIVFGFRVTNRCISFKCVLCIAQLDSNNREFCVWMAIENV